MKKLNREIAVITYIFMFLFLIMAVYIIYFVVHDSEKVLNNTYNKRQEIWAKRVVRGKILSADKKELAKTSTDSEGNEKRVYPYKGLFAHVVGKVDQGKTGLEATEGFSLLTSNINPLLYAFNEIRGIKNPGNDIITTLDTDLSQAASDALGNKKGAVVAIDPESGKILAMVSKPTFDPNNISKARWKKLTSDNENDSALYNRVTQGLYPPGSTFKLYTALEYIRENEDYNKYIYKCNGSLGIEGNSIKCYGGEVHGKVDLKTAFAKSCNTAFCSIGLSLNINNWRKLCESFYYNKNTPLLKLDQKQSQFKVDNNTSKGDIMQAAIGQGDVLVTPLQNSLLVCAALNKGKLMRPYLVDKVVSNSGRVLDEEKPVIVANPMNKEEAKALKKLMRQTVLSGTANSLYSGTPYRAGGKTGSAEFQNDSNDSHAWFVGYAEMKKKKIVVSVIVEAAGTGSQYAVPIAKQVFNKYFS